MLDNNIHHSFKYALSGIKHAVIDNQNFRIQIAIGFITFLLSLYLGLSNIERIVVMSMIVLVISAEMINTSIEEITNLVTREHRVEAKIAKDVSAGMVLLVSTFAAIVGTVIFLPYIIN